MAREEAKQAPHATGDERGEQARFEGHGPRDHATKEAARKNQKSAEDAIGPGATPDPGIHEGYGANSGREPSEEPGNPKKG